MARYFPDEQAKINDLNTEFEEATRAVEEYIEEHAVEDGLLAEAMDEDKITKSLAATRLKNAKAEKSNPEEIKALEHLIELYSTEMDSKKAVKDAQAELGLATLKKYGRLSEEDIKQLVLDDKWNATISHHITVEVNALTLVLVARIQQLGERYAKTVGALDTELEKLEDKVSGHLVSMGIK